MAFTIVVGYDGSDCAKAALDEAIGLAQKLSGKVLVTYAYGGPRSYSGAPLTPRKKLKEVGEKLLDEALAHAGDAGTLVEPVLVDDNATEGLLDVARRHGAGMIVVGSRGQSPIGGMLLGSTTYKLVHSTTEPLLIVPSARTQRAGG